MTLIRPTVRSVFRAYTESLEGRKRNLYADVKGYPTVAAGCIMTPISLALDLDWRIGDRAATHAEIRDDWETINAIGETNRTADSQAPLTSIRLTDEAVDALLWKRLDANAEWLRKHLMPGFEDFSADAQLGILSIAWGTGCDFRNTKPPRLALIKACNDGDWIAAQSHGRLREEGNQGVALRNRHQETLFSNAQTVKERDLDPSWLWWPNVCPRTESLREAAIKAVALINPFNDTDPGDNAA
jgi:GH24 family phage-related lysozyme (muramidase)